MVLIQVKVPLHLASKEGIIHGSKTLMQSSDGQITEPYSISAGLDYPGVGPMHAHLFRSKRAEFISIPDQEAMDWGLTLSQTEGIIPAIETVTHLRSPMSVNLVQRK